MKNKFTLVELLVVVAIFGILMSILLPSIQKARRKALNIVCVNQVKQVGTAQVLYCDDFSGFFPKLSVSGKYIGWSWGWVGNTDRWNGNKVIYRPLNPYLTSDEVTMDTRLEVLECPEDENPEAFDLYGEGKYSWYKVYGTSYGINNGPKRDSIANRGSLAPKSLSQIIDPSRLVMALENHAVNIFQGMRESSRVAWNINVAHYYGKKKFTNLIQSDLSALVHKQIYRGHERYPNWFDDEFTTENGK